MADMLTAQEAAKIADRILGKVPTALYRHYNADGVLLYIGISLQPFQRLREHRQSKWAQSIIRVSVEWFPTRAEALKAEFRAIVSEQPLHNIDMNGPVIVCNVESEESKERTRQARLKLEASVEARRLKELSRPPPKGRKQKRPPITLDEMRAALMTIGKRRPPA